MLDPQIALSITFFSIAVLFVTGATKPAPVEHAVDRSPAFSSSPP